jgi:hypothetical protein
MRCVDLPCVIRVIRFGTVFRAVMGFLAATVVKTGAALFDFAALFGIQMNTMRTAWRFA